MSPNKRCLVTVQYLGSEVHIEYDREWIEPDGDEVIIMQQHCGGENLIVFRGSVKAKGMKKKKKICSHSLAWFLDHKDYFNSNLDDIQIIHLPYHFMSMVSLLIDYHYVVKHDVMEINVLEANEVYLSLSKWKKPKLVEGIHRFH